ncbi:MAG: LCP family protein [Mycobacterium sp.]
MSDGDHATPGRRSGGGSDDDGDRQLMTMQLPGAAPWERWPSPSHDAPRTADRRPTPSRRRSRADGGVSVADLIAKVGGDAPAAIPSRHHAAPGSNEDYDAEITAEPDLWPAFDVAEVAYPSELPDLDRIHHAHTGLRPGPYSGEDTQTTMLPHVSAGIPPVRIAPLHHDYPEDYEPHRKKKTKRARRRALFAGRMAAALTAVLALILTGSAWQWSTSKNASLNKVNALDPNSQDIKDPGGQYGDENFLIVGADTRAGANSQIGAGDADDAGGARSDTIMLVNIPANRKRVVVVSLPRDLAITPIQCEAWSPDTGAYGPLYYEETGTYGDDMVYTETKLNSTYAFGGPKCLVKEIQKLSGLAINRFMAVDFVGFGKMVDALGGVEVCTASPLYDYELGTVLDQTGRQTIDGATALNYVRARNMSNEYNGDYGRIKRQQLFLSSLLRSLISKDTFLSPTKLNNVVNMFIGDSYVDHVTTKDLVNLGQSLQKVAAGHITFVTVPTGETDENGDEPPRVNDMEALFDAIINDDPLPGENDQNATSTPTTAANTTSAASTAQSTRAAQPHSEQVHAVTTTPNDVTVRVSNATGESGVATTASDGLERAGFNVVTPDDYPSSTKATTVMFSPGNEQAAATVASALANPPIERVAGMGSVVRVVLGSDFRGAVGEPAPSGSQVNVQLTRGASTEPTQLPDDLTVTNAADTTCE